MRSTRSVILSSVLLVGLAGCLWKRGYDEAATIVSDDSGAPLLVTRAQPLDPPTDARGEARVMTRLDVYALTIPFGTVSLDENFWKRVDETKLPPDTYDVLFKNGMRVGLAPTAEWEFFREIISRYPSVTQQGDYAANDGKAIEMSVRKDIESQTIFYVDAANRLQGRSYDRCEDLFSLTFHPSMRNPGAIRIAMAPLVRSQRIRIEYDSQNVGNEVQYVSPERLYDLNLKTEIPAEHFLIVALSREGRWPTSIGSTFLTSAGPAEQLERVLLLVPRVVKLNPVTK